MAVVATRPLAVTTATTEEELAALADGWDDLVLAAPRPSPFMLHAWLLEWWRHYGADAELAVHVARRDGRLVAALPLCTRRRRGMRVTEFVGGPTSALGDLLLVAGEDDETPRIVLEHAERDRRDLADLFGLPGSSRLAAAASPGRLRLIERVEAPVLDLSGGWDAVYRAKTDSKKRNHHHRRRRQLSEQGRELTVDLARTIDELEPALEAAFDLHERRWAGRPDQSGFATPTGRQFNRAVLRPLAARDVARILTLKLDGRPIAFNYYFALGKSMAAYRLAFDPALARFSPGLVNTLCTLEAAAEEGLERVEFLGGDERFKLELADGTEPLYQALGLAGSPQGRVLMAARLASIETRRRLKRSPRIKKLYYDGLSPVRRVLRRARPTASE
jgi:CelD/BcsL family acetyltransferase involved in cellulose biosynthesis